MMEKMLENHHPEIQQDEEQDAQGRCSLDAIRVWLGVVKRHGDTVYLGRNVLNNILQHHGVLLTEPSVECGNPCIRYEKALCCLRIPPLQPKMVYTDGLQSLNAPRRHVSHQSSSIGARLWDYADGLNLDKTSNNQQKNLTGIARHVVLDSTLGALAWTWLGTCIMMFVQKNDDSIPQNTITMWLNQNRIGRNWKKSSQIPWIYPNSSNQNLKSHSIGCKQNNEKATMRKKCFNTCGRDTVDMI